MGQLTRRSAASVAVLLLAILQLTWLTTGAGAQDPAEEPPAEEPTTTTTTTPPPATPMVRVTTDATTTAAPRKLELRGQTPFVAPTDTFSLTLAVAQPPEGARLAFVLFPPTTAPGEAVQSRRDRLDEWVAGRAPKQDPFKSPRIFPYSLFTPAADGTVVANFPILSASSTESTSGFLIPDAGVYPLTVSLLPPDSDKPIDSFTTYLIRLPIEKAVAPPLQVAAVMNLHAPVATRPDGTTSVGAEARALIQSTIDLLDRHPAVPLTLDPTPETIAALVPTDPRERNSASSENPIDTLAAAMSGREVLSSTYVDVDVDAWIASRMETHLDRQLTLGFETLNRHLHPTPSADRHTWKTDRALTGESLSKLRDFGVEQMLVPDTIVGPLDAKAFTTVQQQLVSTQPFDIENRTGDKVRVGASDQRLAGRLTASTNPALAAQIALADLALIYFGAADNPNNLPNTSRGVVLDVPSDAAALRSFDALLTALGTVPVPTGGARAAFTSVTLDSYFRIPPATAPKASTPLVRELTPPPADASMGDYPKELADAEKALSAYASMIERAAPERITAGQHLLDVSGAAGFADDQRRAYFDAIRRDVDGVADGVSAPKQDQITLTDFEATVKIQLENTRPYAVDVLVVLSNEQLLFDDKPKEIEIHSTLQPGDNRLPVKVRTLTSCACTIELKVLSPDHSRELDATRYRVRFTVISGLGLILTIAAGFFLMVWWGKNWRTTVRARKLVAIGEHPSGAAEAGASEGDAVDADTGAVPSGSA